MKYHKIIKEICDEDNIKLEILSKDFISKLEKNNKIKYIYGYKFPLNNHAIGEILDDKYAFYEILKNLNIKTVEIKPIFLNYNKEFVKNYLNKNINVILKSNNGTCGLEVYKISNYEELITKIDELLIKNSPVCLSPFYNIKNEYRVIVLNNKIKIIYGKIKPVIIGDGNSNILELLKKFNYNYYSKEENIKSLNYNLEEILPLNKKIEIDFKFNLSRGSKLFMDIDNNKKIKLEKIIYSILNKLDIKFASIDIIETDNDELLVLEANSGVMMDNFIELNENGKDIAKSIYKEAIEFLFFEK